MRPDKAKVVDEVWDDERIEGFLAKAPMGDEAAAFSTLLNAYRSMRVDDFGRFLEKFRAQGGDVNAPGRDGRSLAEVIQTHQQSAEFLALLKASA